MITDISNVNKVVKKVHSSTKTQGQYEGKKKNPAAEVN